MTITMTMTTIIIKKAEQFCVDSGNRLTDPRRYVLNILSDSDKAMTAYDVLGALGQYLDNPKPPTAYRAIDFWVEHGFVHRIESLNAYKICDDCGDVTEAHLCHLPDGLKSKAGDNNFKVNHWSIELHGQCNKCISHA